MSQQSGNVTYRRRETVGTLKLTGIVDVFEAGAFHEVAVKALRDEKAATIKVDARQAERIDSSGLQILRALKRDLAASERAMTVEAEQGTVIMALAQAGIEL